MHALTHDSISLRGAGVITVAQPARGHRFTLDSILLADFCRLKRGDRVLEPGAGTGVVSLLLAKKHPGATVMAFELQPELVRLCRHNIRANGLEDRVLVVERDLSLMTDAVCPRTFEVIVANPPYTKSGAGRPSPAGARLMARHDAAAPLEAWLDLHVLLKQRGVFVLVFPAARLTDALAAMRERRLEPKRLRLVHPYQDRPASLALIEAVKMGGRGAAILPPLIVHRPGGEYTDELLQIYTPE